jgi:hypothetical protein
MEFSGTTAIFSGLEDQRYAIAEVRTAVVPNHTLELSLAAIIFFFEGGSHARTSDSRDPNNGHASASASSSVTVSP